VVILKSIAGYATIGCGCGKIGVTFDDLEEAYGKIKRPKVMQEKQA
jgi:hypothetical protein